MFNYGFMSFVATKKRLWPILGQYENQEEAEQ
jgi:hypothetical protein